MTRSKAAVLAGAVVVITLLAWATGAIAGGGPFTERVSLSSAEVEGNNISDYPSLSTDGRYVAFSSTATNLVAGDTNIKEDIFVRDRTAGNTERVSISNGEAQANGASYSPDISADGRFVVFESLAANLVSGDTNGMVDIFVRDRALGTTVRVSRSTGGTQANGNSEAPAISADGRYVVYSSDATNLVSGDTNAQPDIFLRDLVAGTTSRVSITDSEAQANGGSLFPSISADGRYVAFQSDATNFWGLDANGSADIYFRDRQAGNTGRVSVNNDGTMGNDGSWNPSISGDGQYIAFQSDATNLVDGDTGGHSDIFVHQLETGFTYRVSLNSSEVAGNGSSFFPKISANGRFIAFASVATNLVASDTNGTWDIFLRDRFDGTTSRQSISTGGVQGDDASGYCGISTDGRTVGITSDATNLVTGDGNDVTDVFARINSATTIYWSIRGSDRYDTAIRLSQARFASALPGGAGLVLAPGETFPEALCGAPLASAMGGPVLLTPLSGLNNAVKNEIVRLNPDHVVLIGLGGSIEYAVDQALGAGTTDIDTIIGIDPYEMSAIVAAHLDAWTGTIDTATAIITRGDLFPDAIGVAPLACANKWPILLTGAGTTLNTYASKALQDLNIPKALKVGTYVTLPGGVIGVGNCSGGDRYETNSKVADWSVAHGGLSFWHLGVTTGDKFPDALAAGPYLAGSNGILLLSPLAGPLPLPIHTEIAANGGSVSRVTFIAMVEPVITLVKSLLP
jgi:Tol biopolymer transport system component